jgi:hypothetical protein
MQYVLLASGTVLRHRWWQVVVGVGDVGVGVDDVVESVLAVESVDDEVDRDWKW